MPPLSGLFANNRQWADEQRARDPDFFSRLASQQRPRYMWIGCSDSRVPANEIIGLPPGEVFVHRNIANVVVHSDLNCLSVLQFAIDVLQVRDVIVCGHYGCAGVGAALSEDRSGLSDNWLMHVRDVARTHRRLIEKLPSAAARQNRLAELNVLSQLANVCHTTVVRDAWARGQALCIHGWIYDVKDGLLRDLGVQISAHETLMPAIESVFAKMESAAAE